MTVNAAEPQMPAAARGGLDALTQKLKAKYQAGQSAAEPASRPRDASGRYAQSQDQEGASEPAAASAPAEQQGEPEATTATQAEAAAQETTEPSPEPAHKARAEYEYYKRESQRLAKELEARREEEAKRTRERLYETLAESADKPKDWDDWEPNKQQTWIAQQAAKAELMAEFGSSIPEIRKLLAKERVVDELGAAVATSAAAKAVTEVHVEHPTLPLEDALAIAQRRNPALFQSAEPAKRKQPEKLPASHRVSEPNISSRNQAQPDVVAGAKQLVAETFDPKSPHFGNKDARFQAFLAHNAAKRQRSG